MMQELAIINKKTGEIIEEKVLFIGKNPRYLDKGYVKIFIAFLSDIVETDKIAGKSIRLLLYMIKHLNYNTLEIQIIPSKVIKELNITKITYHRWIRDLIEFGIIEKKDRYTYVLKPYTFVKGSSFKAIENDLNMERKGKNLAGRKGKEK